MSMFLEKNQIQLLKSGYICETFLDVTMFDRHWIWYYYKVSQFIHPIWTRINLINNLVFLLFNFIYSTLSWIHCVAKILDFYFISNAFFLSICQKIEVHFLLFCFQQLLKKQLYNLKQLNMQNQSKICKAAGRLRKGPYCLQILWGT